MTKLTIVVLDKDTEEEIEDAEHSVFNLTTGRNISVRQDGYYHLEDENRYYVQATVGHDTQALNIIPRDEYREERFYFRRERG